MSFTAEVKDELSRVKPECPYCERAVFSAISRICGSLIVQGKDTFRLEISTETGAVARSAIKLSHNVYDLETELTVRKSVLHRTHNYLIALPHQPRLNDALIDMGLMTSSHQLEFGIAKKIIKNDCCAASYARGAFLASGFLADPRGDFHFEMVMGGAARHRLAEEIVQIMERFGVNARIVDRRNESLVYIKNIEDILGFLAFVGAHNSAITIEQVRVVKSLRNDVNRRVNAELANQAKASKASFEQLDDIELIDNMYGLETLPPALQEYSALRKEHPEASLRELGEYATPKLSKSAINHRVRRMKDIADDIRSAYDE